MPAQIFGSQATAVQLYVAFYGVAPSNPIYTNNLAVISGSSSTTVGASTLATAIANQFAHTTDAAMAAQVLANLGISATTTNAAAFTALSDALAQVFAAYGTAARGQIVLNLVNILTTLEGNATYGAAAVAFNATTLNAYTYASNIANTTPGSTSASVIVTNFTLTTGIDASVGTAGADTFNGFVNTTAASTTSTFTAADTINGAAGTDSLNITFDGTGAAVMPAASITGVENIFIRNLSTDGTALAVNADNLVGALQIWNDRGAGASDLTVTNLATGAVAGVRGNGVAQVSDSSFGYKTASAAATIAIDGGVKGGTGSSITTVAADQDAASTTVTISSASTAVTINSTGAANTVNNIALGGAATSLTVNAATDLTVAGAEFSVVANAVTLTDWITGFGANAKITTTGAGRSSLGTLEATTVVEVDGSASTGGTTVALNNVTAMKFTGGSGQDIVTTGAVLAGAGLVDAGAGTTDRLIVSATAHVDATAGKLYKGFEQVQVQSGQTVDVAQLATNNTIDTVRINQSTVAATGVTNLSATQAAAVSIIAATGTGAITIGVKDSAVGGQIDTVKATVTTTTATGGVQAADLTALNLAGVEKLELTGTGTVATTTGAITFTAASATALDSIKFANAANGNSLDVTAVAAANLVVDASASAGGVTINASTYNTTTGATLKGGSSFDVLLGSTRSDSVAGGAGNDVIAGTALGGFTAGTASAVGAVATSIAASSAADSLSGGAGRDVFAIGRVDALTSLSAVTDLDLGGTTAATGADVLYFDLATAAAAGASVIVVLTDTQKATIAATASLAAAVEAALQIGSGANNVVQFTYGTDTYLAVNGATAGFAVADDAIVKITGLTGTLDNTDIVII